MFRGKLWVRVVVRVRIGVKVQFQDVVYVSF